MKKNLYDYSFKGKKVLLRCDLNVPLDNGIITDDTRILASLKTINYLISVGAKIIIFSRDYADYSRHTLLPLCLHHTGQKQPLALVQASILCADCRYLFGWKSTQCGALVS